MISHWSRVRATLFLLIAAFPLLPSGTSAQSGQGFLFQRPTLHVGFDVGYSVAHAQGRVFNHARDQLTLDRSDFDAPSFGIQFGVRVNERFDLGLDLRFSRSDVRSEMRDWLEEGFPIEQTTIFTRVPLSVSGRYYLRDRGRAISRLAWVPAKWAPFVGGGVGLTWYQFEQIGDFVDITSCDPIGCDIVNLTIESDGAGPTGHVFAGVDVSINPRFLWTLEGRYAFGHATTDYAFDYGNLDLGGFQATVGIAVRFF